VAAAWQPLCLVKQSATRLAAQLPAGNAKYFVHVPSFTCLPSFTQISDYAFALNSFVVVSGTFYVERHQD
jgi:hypothetical protein